MAKSKNTKSKKAAKPAKKQAITKKSPAKKTTEKKVVKKIIPTKDKKPKKVVKEKPVKAKKVVVKPTKKVVEKTKKTVDKPAKKIKSVEKTIPAPVEAKVEVKSEAVSVEQVLNTEIKETPVVIPPVVEVKQEVKEEPKEVVQSSNSILPVEDDEDDKKENTMGNSSYNTNSNVQKVYTFNKGIEFMDGHLKIGIDGTNVSRRDDTFFDIYGKSEHGAEFKAEFECIDKEEGDFLVSQLNDCEKNPAPFNKATVIPTAEANVVEKAEPVKSHALDANGNIDMTKLSAEEIMSIQNGNMTAPKADLVGVPLTSVNIDEMINNLPPKPENQNIMSGNITPIANAADISNILNNQNTVQLKSYAQSIADHINTSFQANVWGGMPQNDARAFLNNCDKQYLYELLNDGVGFFLIVKKDAVQVRIPENPTEYLKVK